MNAIDLDAIYVLSGNIVAREIEGEIIIIPLSAGIGDTEDDLFSLNETGRAVWNLLDGTRSVSQIVAMILKEYDTPLERLIQDVTGLIAELEKRHIVEKR